MEHPVTQANTTQRTQKAHRRGVIVRVEVLDPFPLTIHVEEIVARNFRRRRHGIGITLWVHTTITIGTVSEGQGTRSICSRLTTIVVYS